MVTRKPTRKLANRPAHRPPGPARKISVPVVLAKPTNLQAEVI
ncbi:hypothetical protein SAMN05216571_101260 [Onishia taeanensis]|uniref:Uncharacterized protein n=1 Tax=Onishia taeanensis TaxID=284577 RepID=A0A1G7N6R7_9GAMM|nr:hypothetical protein [Halomonas taeanensis]SDF69733.1 hypothetical protein SAMN05216571_101260 [Halomonas taeanensis]